ncbi:glycoside hydrolase family 97 catalytic domain-containing protein [Haloarcula marina]|uniref:glycoside hydrolase family 97 catalytic domain-containing protein n=1 Tax=Haloarcula marina TaxID=2961574 RepID=UPI0020B7CD11|nr:glycoside hydrolase family 97 catalytic domain-containing protein [Halomicroarcula marina]
MAENPFGGSGSGLNRRDFLGGVTGLLAAAAYSRDVPAEVAAQVTSGDSSDVQSVTSPDGSIEMTVDLSSGVPTYSVSANGTTYIDPSPLGFNFANQAAFGTGISGTGPDITVTGTDSGTATENWTPQWGDFASVSEDYNYLTIGLEETASPGRSANLRIRVFDDGLGFQWAFDSEFGDFAITSENTEFNFSEDYTAWWIRNEFVNPRFEQEYNETNLSGIDAGSRTIRPNDNTVRSGAHTPVTMQASDGTYLSVHESNLDDYASMSLASKSDTGSKNMATELAPLPDGTKVSASAPHVTPWRTVQIGSTPGELVESQLIPLLADPLDESVLPTAGGSVDTDWITARKYVGIWWTMIAGSANWEYKSDSEISGDPAAYIHGARTERMKRYMSFASQNGMDSVLVEGWNQGWDTYPGDGSGLEMGVADSYPDFDVPEVTDYGAALSNSVEMTIHNETAGNIVNYEDEIQNNGIFQEYEDEGIRSIKNGYVSDPGLGFEGDGTYATHNQHCQLAVNHHRLVIKQAAADRQMLEIHEGIKPTGEIRTYPNVAAREVVKAQEYDGFGALGSNVGRDHHVLLPYTRMLAGPTSYQPGIFDITFNDDEGDQIQTTRAKQLAMYPTYLGGIQMAADRIEAYVDSSLEVGEFVQAQSGELDGMITADKWRNAYGAHYVPVDPNREPSGASVTFTVKNVPSAGDYDLHFRYASDSSANSQRVIDNGGPEATLSVNGSTQKIQPSYTNYWDDWGIHTTTVSLDAGDNTVAVELNYSTDGSGTWTGGDVGGFNLNSVAVSDVGAGSPVAADYANVDPSKENFDTEPEFDYIENVPASWDETVAVDGEIGDYIVTAKRSGDEWYVGAMTDETARDVTVSLDFLASQPDGWTMTKYADAAGTDVDTNPTDVAITESNVAAGDGITFSMGAGGGTALRLVPAESSSSTFSSSLGDASGDDAGPGAYTYPTDSSFEDGAFDLLSFDVDETSSTYDFTFEVSNLYDAFSSGNFSPHYFVVWLRDPSLSGGSTTENGDLNVTAEFDAAWHYRVDASGYSQGVIDAAGNSLSTPGLSVDLGANTVTLSVAQSTMSDVDIENAEVVPVVGSEDYGAFRDVQESATQWQFGGAQSGAVGNAPSIIDMVTPDGVSQSSALAYDGSTLASLPFTSL